MRKDTEYETLREISKEQWARHAIDLMKAAHSIWHFGIEACQLIDHETAEICCQIESLIRSTERAVKAGSLKPEDPS